MEKELYATPETILEKGRQWVASLDRKRSWNGPPNKAALLILDMQSFFMSRKSHAFIPTAPAVIDVIVQMTAAFKGPVIATRHLGDEDGSNLMNSWWRDNVKDNEAEIIHELKGIPDVVFDKHHYSAFHETGLERYLEENGVDSIIITGVHTDLCCETTARDAFMKGYKIYLIADGTATSTEERHISALKIISIGFGEVLTSAESRSLL
ncbi:MAG: isochorismatase family protein [Thermoplasmatota archaeon]